MPIEFLSTLRFCNSESELAKWLKQRLLVGVCFPAHRQYFEEIFPVSQGNKERKEMLIQGDVSSNWLLPTFLSWNCPLSLHIGIFRSCPQGSLATMCACRHPHPTTGHWLRERRMQGPVSCATSSLPLTSRHHNSPWFLSVFVLQACLSCIFTWCHLFWKVGSTRVITWLLLAGYLLEMEKENISIDFEFIFV